MREVEDRRVWIGVDCDNHVGAFYPHPVLNCTGYSSRNIELRPDCFAGLSNLPVRCHPAFLDEGPRTAIFPTQHLGERFHELKILSRAQAQSPRDNNIRISELGLVRLSVSYKLQDLGHDVVFQESQRMFDDTPTSPGLSCWHRQDTRPHSRHLWPVVQGQNRTKERTAEGRPGRR